MFRLYKKQFEDQLKEHYVDIDDLYISKVNSYDASKNQYLMVVHKAFLPSLAKSDIVDKIIESINRHQYDLAMINLVKIEEIKPIAFDLIDESLFNGEVIFYSFFTNKVYRVNCLALNSINHFDLNHTTYQIRHFLKTNKLKVKSYLLGKESKTGCNLLYLDDLANKDIIHQIDKALENEGEKAVNNIEEIEVILFKNKHSLLPLVDYISDKEMMIQALLKGQFIIILDNQEQVLVGPCKFSTFLNKENRIDNYTSFTIKLAKYLALIFALVTSGLLASLYLYNIELLPYSLLNIVINERSHMSINVLGEFILIELFLLVLKLPLNRIKDKVMTSGLILLATILLFFINKCGLVGMDILIFSCLSFIALHLVTPNKQFTVFLTFARLYILFGSIFFGLVGFIFHTFWVLLYIFNQNSFTIPYVSYFAPSAIFKKIMDLLGRYGKNEKLMTKGEMYDE